VFGWFMEKYRFLDHTADVLFEAFGKDLGELFEHAALALEETQVVLDGVGTGVEKVVSLENNKIDMLLFDFLQELIYLKDAELLLFSKFDVTITGDGSYKLSATCFGEKIDQSKHEFTVDAKAITLHQFEVVQENGVWKARVIVDI
jgi:SHS2 domain-containing protein